MAFTYEKLGEDARRDQVNGRLTSLESAHYQARLDVLSATEEAGVTDAQNRARMIEGQIMKLREEEASLAPRQAARK